MSCKENQCCAVTDDNKRCLNSAIHGTFHCNIHYTKAIKLYKNYKRVCETAYKLNINQNFDNINDRIAHITKCYLWLNKAFDARMNHRKYAFAPECYNEGHNFQFEIITKKIKKCEKVLNDLWYQQLEISFNKDIFS